MNRARAKLLAAITLAFAASLTTSAQPAGACRPDQTVADCYQSFEATASTIVRNATDAERQELRALPTGADTGGANLASNRRNFLPLLALTGLFNQGSQLNDSGTLVLDFNFLIPGSGEGRNAQLQGVVNTQPKVSGALREALPEDGGDELLGRLTSQLSDSDDAALRLTYSPVSRRLGRSFEPHEDAFAAFAGAAIRDILTPRRVAEAGLDLATFVGSSGEELAIDASEMRIGDLPEATRAELTERIGKVGRQLAVLEAEATRAVQAASLDRFHKLVDNQPQWLFTAERKFRDSLVGPEELGLKLTWELGRINVNRLQQAIGERCMASSAPGSSCLANYSAFVTKHSRAIDHGDRFSFSGEYVDLHDDLIDPGIDGLEPTVVDSANKLILSAGWSRRFDAGDAEPVLLDLVASYEDVSDDPLRQDRGIITLTITRNFAGIPVPLGIVYANHGEYLGDVDEQLSAHLGIKFNAFGSKKE